MDIESELTSALVRFGPPLLGVLTFFETSSLIGLFVPAGVAFLLAGFLTIQGTLAVLPVLVWALAGAVLGDSVGYWLGTRSNPVDRDPRGVFGRVLARLGPKKLSILAGSPFYAVSLARVVSFVRTLAPMAAGASRMSYGRFLGYNLLGIALWGATYLGVGTLAGESWKRVSQFVGAFWTVVFAIVAGGAFWAHRRRRSTADSVAPLSVGLTGNAASGKSTVAALWRGQGVPVVDADVLAREAVRPGSAGLAEVVAAFGSDVEAPDGTLDRDRLRDAIFADPARRRQLEAILHPRIAHLRAEWVEAQKKDGHPVIVSEIPLLFEAGLEGDFDQIVLVHVPREVSLARMVETRGLTPEAAAAILDAQLPSEEKRGRSDHVIQNLSSKGDLEDSAMHVLGQLRARAAENE